MKKEQKRVCQYDFSGRIVNIYNSSKEAEQSLSLPKGSVLAVCNRHRNSVGGFIFRYENDCEDIPCLLEIYNPETGFKRVRKVYQYDMDGSFLKEWPSIAEAKRNVDGADNIVSACSGFIRSSGGYVWSYIKSNRIEVKPRKKRKMNESFEDYCLNNGLMYLLEEWDEINNSFNPSDVSYGSNKKVAWKCKLGHKWEASIYSRVSGRGCKECKSQMNTSFPEQIIYHYVSKYFPSSINKYSNSTLGVSEIDVYIPELNIGIEYDGKRWHRDVNKDINKDIACRKVGIKMIRIREEGCPQIASTSIVIETNANWTNLNKAIISVLQILSDRQKTPIEFDVNIERDYLDILATIRKMEKRKSIATQFPEIALEWDYEKNKKIMPSAVAAMSNVKYWWVCSTCGYSYRMIVSNRTRAGQGCPRCGRENSRLAKIRTINQYDLNGNYLASFAGAKEAVRVTNLKYHQNINAVCERKQKSAGGFIWRYADDCNDIEKIEIEKEEK